MVCHRPRTEPANLAMQALGSQGPPVSTANAPQRSRSDEARGEGGGPDVAGFIDPELTPPSRPRDLGMAAETSMARKRGGS
jgi:hypothetical protein